MKLQVDLAEFWKQIHRISIDIEILIPETGQPIDEILSAGGLEIKPDQVDFQDGLPVYKGRQILLYIPDQGRKSVREVERNPDGGRRFHIFNCQKLKSMLTENRFDRYIATNNLSGEFRIYGEDACMEVREGTAKLKACKYCLKELNYNNYNCEHYQKKIQIWNEFSISEFFEVYSTLFPALPRDSIPNPDYGSYTKDWPEISSRLRRDRTYVCDECCVSMKSAPHLLHVHHVNGHRGDNSLENLRPLCLDCHRKQPNHGRMQCSYSEYKTIALARYTQGIRATDWPGAFRLSDLAARDFLRAAKQRGWPLPEVGIPMTTAAKNEILAALAWPDRKIAVTAHVDRKVPDWRVYAPTDLSILEPS